MTPILVEVPMALPSVANLREHWAVRAKRTRAQRDATGMALVSWTALEWRRAFLSFYDRPRLVVDLTRISPRPLDSDNLSSAFKGVRDQVAAHFGIDDGDTARIRFTYSQAKGKPARFTIALSTEPM